MALTNTSLAAAFSATQLVLKATAATGATVGGFAKVDGEYMTITAISGTNISVGQRGSQGTAVVAHAILAPLTFGLYSDVPDAGATGLVPPVITSCDLVTIGSDGVIAVPARDTIFVIQKGAALASSTLGNPSAAQSGIEVTITSGTDFAHVVTTVAARDGTTGLSTVLTFPEFNGASVKIIAVKGKR